MGFEIVAKLGGLSERVMVTVAESSMTIIGKPMLKAMQTVGESEVGQQVLKAGSKFTSETLETVAKSETTKQFAQTGAQTVAHLVRSAMGADNMAIHASQGESQTVMKLVDRLVASETERNVLRQQLVSLGHQPVVVDIATKVAGETPNTAVVGKEVASKGLVGKLTGHVQNKALGTLKRLIPFARH